MTHTQAHDADFDRGFLSRLIAHHGGAIDMARVALDRAEHPELRQLAQNIIDAQQAEQIKMRAWLDQWYPNHADDMGGMDMSAMNEELATLRQAQPFDRAFIDAMVPDHEAAIREAQTALDRAERAEVRELAQNVVTSQQGEIDQMRAWRAAWYGA